MPLANLLQSVCSIWFDGDPKVVSSSIAASPHSAVLVVLPPDNASETYFDDDIQLQFVATLKSHVPVGAMPSKTSLDQFADVDALILPRVRASDGYVLIFNDGQKRHIWFDFRQCGNRLWDDGTEPTQIREPLKHGLYSRQIEAWLVDRGPERQILETNGWYPVLTVFPRPYRDTAKLYGLGNGMAGDQVAYDFFTAERVAAMRDAWLSVETFRRRANLLDETVCLYHAGRFAASTTLSVAQFSGIMFEEYRDAKDSKIADYLKSTITDASPHLLCLTADALAQFVTDVFEGPGRDRGACLPLDRKSIMHGNKTQFTRRDALQALILLDCLYAVLKSNPVHEKIGLQRAQ
ncbi:MAG: hypothetical protein NT025_08775 [bacterium]|nr:hypothetical protein [bacterium]